MDWNKLWQEEKYSAKARHGSDYWDSFAPKYRKHPGKSTYETDFLALADIRAGETVFDMGCASGTLALPLAEAGHKVFAADFSMGMLELLNRQIAENNLKDRITTMQLDWNEDWNRYDIPICDVAIASRSMIVSDLEAAVDKLQAKALRKVCIVEPTTESPHFNVNIAKYIGYDRFPMPDFVYLINILFEKGIMPELRYIYSERTDFFESREAAYDKMIKFFPEPLTSSEDMRLREYLRTHLTKTETGQYTFDECWPVRWAYISWEKQRL